MSRTRVYVGRLSRRTDEEELDYHFGKLGPVRSIDIKNGYAFVEYNDERDADDAVDRLDGADIDGSRVIVQHARGRARTGPGGGGGGGASGPPVRTEYRAIFEYLPRDMSWQDLKDFCRKTATPTFTDVWRDRGIVKGVAEFRTYEELRDIVEDLDRIRVDGEPIDVYEDSRARKRSRAESVSPGPSPKRGRRSSPPRRGSRSPSPRPKSMSPRGRSISPDKRSRSPRKDARSPSPRRGSLSPPRRSPSPRRGSPSPRRGSPSPRRRSPSPGRRSPSPRRGSPSPRRPSPSPGPRSPPRSPSK
mmetsp:Transcript_25707/g.72018  ORF Transcript_25707/g.72018 Transcript_25707/m.72018 type:complete len:303 (+) Transcript_25707:129-1037(+)